MKVLMLDVDGVLVDGRPRDGRHLFTDLERDLGLSLSVLRSEFFERHWEEIVTGREALLPRLTEVLGKIAPNLEAQTLLDYWFTNDSRLVTGVLDELPHLRRDGIAVWLASNQEHLRARWLMDELGLAAHVDGIVYSAALGARKPTPDFYRLAADNAGAVGDEIVLVDDSPANVDAARSAGWCAVHWTGDQKLSRVLAPFR